MFNAEHKSKVPDLEQNSSVLITHTKIPSFSKVNYTLLYMIIVHQIVPALIKVENTFDED